MRGRVPAIAAIFKVLPAVAAAFGNTGPVRNFPEFAASFRPVVGSVCLVGLIAGGPSGRFVAGAAVLHLWLALGLGAWYYLRRPRP